MLVSAATADAVNAAARIDAHATHVANPALFMVPSSRRGDLQVRGLKNHATVTPVARQSVRAMRIELLADQSESLVEGRHHGLDVRFHGSLRRPVRPHCVTLTLSTSTIICP